MFCRNTSLQVKSNPNYVDGKTLVKHFCSYPGCKKQINIMTVYEGGMCHKHGHLGEKNGRYIDGRTPFYQLIRGCYQMRQWAEAVRKKEIIHAKNVAKRSWNYMLII